MFNCLVFRCKINFNYQTANKLYQLFDDVNFPNFLLFLLKAKSVQQQGYK